MRLSIITLLVLFLTTGAFAQSQAPVLTGTLDGFSDVDTITPNGFPLSSFMVSVGITNTVTGAQPTPPQCHYADSVNINPTTFTYDTTAWPVGTYTIAHTLFRPNTSGAGNVKSNCANINGIPYGEIDSTWTVSACPTAPLLNNSVQPSGGDPLGITDSTTAFQNALNTAGSDLDIPPGTWLINGILSVPNNKNIRCETGAILKTTNTANSSNFSPMFSFSGDTGGSLFNCSFQGPNFNASGRPSFNASAQFYFFVALASHNGVGGGITVANNDFNGSNANAAVTIYGSDSGGPSNNNVVSCNTFEHSGLYGAVVVSGNNNKIRNNKFLDSSCCSEVDDLGQQQTGNLFDGNTFTFVNGVGYTGDTQSADLTGGHTTSICFDYSGNTVSNNNVSGPYVHSYISEAMPCGHAAVYTNNTCTGGCLVN